MVAISAFVCAGDSVSFCANENNVQPVNNASNRKIDFFM